MLNGKLVACDTETSGFNPYRGDRVFLHSFANEEGEKLSVYETPENRPALVKFYADASVTKVFHNCKFDIKMLSFSGYKVAGEIHDTAIMARLFNEYENHNLKRLGEQYIPGFQARSEAGIDEWFAANGMKKSSDRKYNLLPENLVRPYAEDDAWLTMMLFYYFREPTQAYWDFYRKEVGVALYMIEVENRGVQIDLKYCREQVRSLKKQRNRLQKEVAEEAGMKVETPRDVMAALFMAGEVCKARTEKGFPATDSDSMKLYTAPFVQKYVSYKETSYIIDTIENQIVGNLDSKNIIHTNFNLSKARTGRFSSSAPNLQNIRRSGGIREAFVPRAGFKLFYFDYSQIEIRLCAHFTDYPIWIKGFNEDPNYDVHGQTSARLGIDRYNAKVANFQIQYGGGPKAIAKELKLSLAEATSIFQKYHEGFPQLNSLRDRLIAQCHRDGYITDGFGRHYHVEKDDEYKIVNTLIQGCACSLLKEAMLRCRKLLVGKKSGMVQNIHDELVFEIHDDEYDLIPLIKAEMENFKFKVPIKVDIEYADTNWGEKKEYESVGN